MPLGTQYPGGSDTASSYLGTTRLDGSQQFPTSFEDEQARQRDYGYDSKSGLTSATDLAGQQWQYQYAPAAGSGVSYDVMSGSVSTANQDGGASAYQPSGGGTEYRDVATTGGSDGGNFSHMLSQVTSPMGEVTKFERGTNGRINKVTYPDGGTRTISYDAANRAQTITLPQGTVVNLGHDGLGRETSRTTSTGEFRYLTYGVSDRIETMTDNTGTTDYEYDSAGRFSGIVYPHGGSVRYTRDKLDRTTDVTVKATASATAINTHYEYDENGNLAEITDPLGGVAGFQYDDVDRLEQRVLPNGVVTSYGYDSRDRVLSVVHQKGSTVLASVAYVRSPSGEPTKITREDGSYVALEYDTALRVKKESYFDASDNPVQSIEYGYDHDGNRTSRKVTANASVDEDTYSYEAAFKLTSVSHSGGGSDSYTYDNGGRLVGMDRGGVQRTIEYDSMDHLTKVIEGGVENVRYTFDGVGRRVSVDDGTGAKRFLTAPNLGDGYESPQAVTDDSGALIATFIYAGEHPIAKITPSGVEYLLGDAMGSVIGKANSAGASTASIKYDGFGEVTGGVNTGIDPAVGFEHRLHGMTLDAATGLYFVRARSYDARTGRFTSRDPIGGAVEQPDTMHPYVLDLNNPHIWRDPTGEATILEMVATYSIIAIIGSIAGPAFQKYLNGARALRAGTNFGAQDYAAGIGDFMSFTLGKTLRDLLGLGAEVDTDSVAYHAGSATAFVVDLWASFLQGVANATVRAESLATGSASRNLTADGLEEATRGIPSNGHKMLGVAQLLSRAAGLSPLQKQQLMLEFFKKINFAFKTKPGQDLILYSEKFEYGFKFAEDGRILYGRFSTEIRDYVWSVM